MLRFSSQKGASNANVDKPLEPPHKDDPTESPKAENWEIVDAGGQESDGGSIVRSLVGSELSAGSEVEKGKFLGDCQEYQFVHAQAVAQIEAAQKRGTEAVGLPVSTDIQSSDVQIISDESLSGFSSPGESVSHCTAPDLSKPSEGVEVKKFSLHIEDEKCQQVSESKISTSNAEKVLEGMASLPQEEPEAEEIDDFDSIEKIAPVPETHVRDPGYDEIEALGNGDDNVESFKQERAAPKGWISWMMHHWTMLIRGTPACLLGFYLRPFRMLFGRKDVQSLVRSAGVAMLSAMVVGLCIRNRKLTHELKRKHEEITRLMVTLMNFQELWNSNRSNAPVLRHASIVLPRTC